MPKLKSGALSTLKVNNVVEKTTDNLVFVDKIKAKGLLQNPNTFNYVLTVDANTNALMCGPVDFTSNVHINGVLNIV